MIRASSLIPSPLGVKGLGATRGLLMRPPKFSATTVNASVLNSGLASPGSVGWGMTCPPSSASFHTALVNCHEPLKRVEVKTISIFRSWPGGKSAASRDGSFTNSLLELRTESKTMVWANCPSESSPPGSGGSRCGSTPSVAAIGISSQGWSSTLSVWILVSELGTAISMRLKPFWSFGSKKGLRK